MIAELMAPGGSKRGASRQPLDFNPGRYLVLSACYRLTIGRSARFYSHSRIPAGRESPLYRAIKGDS